MGMPGTSWSAEMGNIFGFNSELISLCPPELCFVAGFFFFVFKNLFSCLYLKCTEGQLVLQKLSQNTCMWNKWCKSQQCSPVFYS